MKEAYVVTLYRGYNYGSALQCYSLQQAIKKFDIKPYAMDIQYSGMRWKIKRLYNNLKFYISCTKYPERKIAFQGLEENAKVAGIGIPEDAKKKFDQFINEKINIKQCKFDALESMAGSDKCIACISGSDQVWGTSVKYINTIHFLTFAPENKRYSYAASFGSNAIPKWFVEEIGKHLRSYRCISVREESAIRMLNDLGIKNGKVMIDPTLLLTAEEWTLIEKRPDIDTNDFEFMYFLNTPSATAINHIGRIRKQNKKDIVCYAPFDNINGTNMQIKTLSLSPEEFVWMIHNCKRFYTDSYHGVVFATIFHKDFYVYQREYVGVTDQSSRITNILFHLNLSNQLITSAETVSIPDYCLSDRIISKDRDKSYSYLYKILTPN